jgi:hypothetical protein
LVISISADSQAKDEGVCHLILLQECSPVLTVVSAWQRADITQVSHTRAGADADGCSPRQIAGVQLRKGVQVVKVFLLCQVNGGVVVGVLASANKTELIHTVREQLGIT